MKIKPIRINESYMIWLRYTTETSREYDWKEVKIFVTFGSEDEDIEVKEMGVRLVCDEDLDQVDLSMFQDLPTLSPHGGNGMISLCGHGVWIPWSCALGTSLSEDVRGCDVMIIALFGGETTRCEHYGGGSSNRVASDVAKEEVVDPGNVKDGGRGSGRSQDGNEGERDRGPWKKLGSRSSRLWG
ncbi:hypothetical protein Tco_1008814 [Tanacetum coccineum]